MTRDEAEAAARRLGTEHPDRKTHRWIARAAAGETWEVVKVRMPENARIDPLKTAVESKPKPPQPGDPRTSYDRNVGGPWSA